MAAGAKSWRMAESLPFGLRREMARGFGGIEPYGRRGGFAIRFRIEGETHRIAAIPIGTRWIPLASRELAQEILEEIRGEIRKSGDPVAAVAPYMRRSRRFGLEARWEEWCDVQDARAAAGQLSRQRAQELRGHLSRGHLDPLRETPLQAIDYAQLEALQIHLFDARLAPKTVHHVLADVRTFLRWCLRRGLVGAVPEVPSTQVPEHVPTIPSLVEQRVRLQGIPEEARGLFLARGLLGIRQGEAFRATVADYRRIEDPETGEIRDQLLIDGKGRRYRPLPVPAELAAWVRKHRPPLAEAGEPLFVNPSTGGAWSKSSMIRTWRAMEKELGLEHVKPNEALRHCFGTRKAEELIARGMSREQAVSELMPILGHTSRATTGRYVKLAAETLREVIE